MTSDGLSKADMPTTYTEQMPDDNNMASAKGSGAIGAAGWAPEKRASVEKSMKRKLDMRCSLFVLIVTTITRINNPRITQTRNSGLKKNAFALLDECMDELVSATQTNRDKDSRSLNQRAIGVRCLMHGGNRTIRSRLDVINANGKRLIADVLAQFTIDLDQCLNPRRGAFDKKKRAKARKRLAAAAQSIQGGAEDAGAHQNQVQAAASEAKEIEFKQRVEAAESNLSFAREMATLFDALSRHLGDLAPATLDYGAEKCAGGAYSPYHSDDEDEADEVGADGKNDDESGADEVDVDENDEESDVDKVGGDCENDDESATTRTLSNKSFDNITEKKEDDEHDPKNEQLKLTASPSTTKTATIAEVVLALNNPFLISTTLPDSSIDVHAWVQDTTINISGCAATHSDTAGRNLSEKLIGLCSVCSSCGEHDHTLAALLRTINMQGREIAAEALTRFQADLEACHIARRKACSEKGGKGLRSDAELEVERDGLETAVDNVVLAWQLVRQFEELRRLPMHALLYKEEY